MNSDLIVRDQDMAAILNSDNPFAVFRSKELARSASFFCAMKAHILRQPTMFCTNLVYWINKGLTLEDAKAIFRRLADPEMTMRHKWESELIAEMAELVNMVLRRRKTFAEMKMRREEAARPRPEVTLADFWKIPTTNEG